MIIMPFDSETNAIPDWKMPSESSHQPHLVSLAAALVDSITGEVMEKMDVIIKPEGWEITQETIDIHGITMERAMDEGIPEVSALHMLMVMWRKSQKRIAFNTTFDNRIIRIAQTRYFQKGSDLHVELMRSWQEDKALYYCVMQAAKKAMGASKLPTLGEAYSHFMHKPLENAHQAMADCMACMDIYFAINDKDLPAEPAPMPAAANDLIAELDDPTGITDQKPDDEVAFL
jgi:DNA polymerase III epsilon subunit-like protein